MNRSRTKLMTVVLLMLLAAMPAWAKRKPAPEVTPVVYQGIRYVAPVVYQGIRYVAPVVYQGIRYVAPNLAGDKGYVQAWDIKTGKQLWQTLVYAVQIDPRKETDVQWRFITGLSLQGDLLSVTNEAEERFSLDRRTGRVTGPSGVTPPKSGSLPFPGTISLLPGYTIISSPGEDSHPGTISKAGGVTINYDIGKMAGDAARYQRDTMKTPYVWFKEQTVQGKRVEILLSSLRSLVVSFPESSANFFATPETEADLVDVLLMVLTYTPSEPKAR